MRMIDLGIVDIETGERNEMIWVIFDVTSDNSAGIDGADTTGHV
jgi:hypothetical protein